MDNPAINVESALEKARQLIYQSNPSSQAKLEAEILLSHLLSVPRVRFYSRPEQPLTETQIQDFFVLIKRRTQGEPIAYIIGQREFWGLNLKVSPDTLIPRADTETLVETALNKIKPIHSPDILDLGTGSGAIALALAHERSDARVIATDASQGALALAQQNANNLKLKVEFLAGSWFEALNNSSNQENKQPIFDLIVSNPPYIEQQDPHLQQGDLRFEPSSALVSGQDGLDDIRTLVHQAWCFLKPRAWLMIEHGYNQADSIRTLFEQQGYQAIELVKDLSGQPRVTLGQKP